MIKKSFFIRSGFLRGEPAESPESPESPESRKNFSGPPKVSKVLKVVLLGYVFFFCCLLGKDQILPERLKSLQRVRDGIEQQGVFFRHASHLLPGG